MEQTRLESLTESWVNVFIGFPINYGANIAILPWAWDPQNPASSAFWIGVMFTVISVVRSYYLRRYFNAKRFSQNLVNKYIAWKNKKYVS
jgi:hypothetical protein